MRLFVLLGCVGFLALVATPAPAKAQSASPELMKSYRQYQALDKAGKYSEATPHAERVLKLAKVEFGTEHETYGDSLINLALLYHAQGRYKEAERLNKRALAIYEKVLGPQNAAVGTSLSNLAGVYLKQGRYEKSEPLYLRALAITENALGREHSEVGQILNNLAALYLYQGRYKKAEPLFKRNLAIYEKKRGPEHPRLAQTLSNLAGLYGKLGRYKEAELLNKRALAIREKALGRDHPSVGHSLNNLATTFKAQGRYKEAEQLYKRNLSLYEKTLGPEHPTVGQILNNLAGLYRVQGRYREAEQLFVRSIKIRKKALGSQHPLVGHGFNDLAAMYSSLGHFKEAETLYKRSIALFEKALGPQHPNVDTSLSNLAYLYFQQSRWTQATLHWRRATQILITRATRQAGGIGQVLVGKKKSEAVRKNGYFRGLIKAIYHEHGGHLQDITTIDEMFTTAQWALGSEAAGALAQMAARSAARDPALAKVVRERQDLVGEWQSLDKQRIAAISKPATRRNKTSDQATVTRLAAIDKRIVTIDRQLNKDFPDYTALANPNPLSIKQVQAQLGHDEILVLFLDTRKAKPTPGETFIWVVAKTKSRLVRIKVGEQTLYRNVATLRCGLDRDGAWEWSDKKQRRIAKSELCRGLWPQGLGARQPLPFDADFAHQVYKRLFGKIGDMINGKKLLIVPSGPLTTLPFHVLVTEKPDAADAAARAKGDYSNVAWLARKQAITVLPSVASLKSLRQLGKTAKAMQPFIGFGNPLLEGNAELLAQAKRKAVCRFNQPTRVAGLLGRIKSALDFTSLFRGGAALADIATIRAQIALPETADELCAIAQSTGAPASAVNLAERATESRIKTLSEQGKLADARIIEIATHGLLAREAKSLVSKNAEPGLIMTPPATATARDDGFLSASEIAGLKLNADWVILSACNTAGSSGEAGDAEALSGLARAFFYAGARALLVSHWYVNSDAAVSLTTGALSALKTNPQIGRAEALRRSMLALIDKGGYFAHPSFWAPFIIVGEGSSGR